MFYDVNDTAEKLFKIQDFPSTIIITPDSKIFYKNEKHLSEGKYLKRMNKQLKRLL